MKRLPFPGLSGFFIAALIAHLPSHALACTACMGDANTRTAGAMNGAIFLMLGCIGLMLGLLSAFAIHLMRRGAAPLPPHADFSQPDSDRGANS